MYDDLMLSPYEPLVPPAASLSDWSRVPPSPRRPAPPPPRFGQKKKPAKKKELHYYQLVTRGLA